MLYSCSLCHLYKRTQVKIRTIPMLVQGMNFYSDEKNNPTIVQPLETENDSVKRQVCIRKKTKKKNKGVNITVFIAHGREFGSLNFT